MYTRVARVFPYFNEYAFTTEVVIGAILTATTAASALVAANNGRLARRFSNLELVATGFLCYGLSLIGIEMPPSLVVITLLIIIF